MGIGGDGVKYQPYPKYKPSGIEWLGEVPEHWRIKRLKCAAKIIMGQSPSSDAYTTEDNGMPFLQGNAEFGAMHPFPRYFCDAATKRAPSGAILVSVRAPVGALNIADRYYGIGRGLCAVVPDQHSLLPEFCWYALTITRQELWRIAKGSTYESVSADEVAGMTVPIPSIEDQQALTRFLDQETKKIDALVAKKRALIEKLKEKRAALISRTVTRGLPPDVARAAGLDSNPKLKPSGVEWLGDVPEHWELKRLSYIALLRSGESITSEQIETNGDYPVYGGNGLRGYYSDFTHIGDYILIGRQGALCGNINYATGKFWASEHAVVVNPLTQFASKWLGEVLRAMNLNQYSVSAAQPGLSVSNIGGLKVPFPPLREQNILAGFLEHETSKIDRLISTVEAAIEHLQEYRTALITAAVTGKIDVRGAVQ